MTFDEICDVQYLSKSLGSEYLHLIIFIYHSTIPIVGSSLTGCSIYITAADAVQMQYR